MPKRTDFVFSMKAAYLGAFAHPLRLQVIELLRHKELSVGAISRATDTAQPTVSKHLALLRQQGVVSTRQAGVTVYYRLEDRAVLHFLKQVTGILRNKLQKSQRVLDHLSKELP